MKTKEEMLAKGYAEDWMIQCKNCGSWDCHKYQDGIILCFDCKQRGKE